MDTFDHIPGLRLLTLNEEDFSKFFCSELVAAGLKKGEVLSKINSSEVTPTDLCMFNIYGDNYFQLKGKSRVIKGYNSLNPDGWGS